MIVAVKYVENSQKIWVTYNIKNQKKKKIKWILKLLRKKPAVSLAKFIIYKIV